MLPNPSPMQEALFTAAGKANTKWLDKVLKVADKQRVRPIKDNMKLSYRTAMKLKAEGVIA